jgi:hypothetical protein
VAGFLAFWISGSSADAHPIVSTDINRHVTLRVTDDRLEIRYLYEMLEIAAINTARAWDADGDGKTSAAERDAYAANLGAELLRHLHVRLDDDPVPLTLERVRWELGEGAMGLATWKLHARFTAHLPLRAATGALDYRDDLRPDEVGWKEVMLTAGGSAGIARASVPSHDRTYELTDYNAISELPNPNQTTAQAVLRFGAAPVAEMARAPDAPAATSARREPATPRISGQAQGSRAKPKAAPPVRPAPVAPASRAETAERGPAGSADGSARPQADVRGPAPVASPLVSAWQHYAWPFFKLGVHHIATGYDHLLFLLGLLLFRQSLGRLAAVVTAFTVAHSITLAVAAAGWVRPPGAVVELLIAASIAYVGAATLLRPRTLHGPWIALGFGLMHGFGFAGALSAALSGVAGKGWLVALASFNLGIEAFQLALVVVAWPLLRRVDPFTWSAWLRRVLSATVLAAGLVWTIARAAAVVG